MESGIGKSHLTTAEESWSSEWAGPVTQPEQHQPLPVLQLQGGLAGQGGFAVDIWVMVSTSGLGYDSWWHGQLCTQSCVCSADSWARAQEHCPCPWASTPCASILIPRTLWMQQLGWEEARPHKI